MRISTYRLAPAALGLAFTAACAPVDNGTPGSPAVATLSVPGTIFTIVFENEDASSVIGNPAAPYFTQLARTYGTASAYVGTAHPSLPNYIQMTSGDIHDIHDDNDPASHPIPGTDNLADQLDAASVPWRAYIESMGTPCNQVSAGLYAAKHNPWVYYTDLTGNASRCADRVVDYAQHFTQDLAAGTYRYMWLTPNLCDDMHNCDAAHGDAWLHQVVPAILASPGYQRGGAIFILFDEGGGLESVFNQPADLPVIVITPRLPSPGFVSNVAYGHPSYLATVEDALQLPRLASTQSATPMADFFGVTMGDGGTADGSVLGDASAGPAVDAGVTLPP